MRLSGHYQPSSGLSDRTLEYAAIMLSGSADQKAIGGLDTVRFLRRFIGTVDGVASIRILPKSERSVDHPKVFIVTTGPDINRDRRLVEIMCQLEDVDYDLVPIDSAEMIPDGARPL